MGNVPICSKSEFLRQMLTEVDFGNKIVLDAGTGGWSARFLAQRKPKEMVCIAGPGDIRKVEEAKNSLQSMCYANYQIILENLIDENLFPSNTFDFVLADYLIEEVDGFAPQGIYEVLCNLYIYLRKEGELVIVNPEPYVPFRPEYELTSMLEIQGDAQLEKRSNRDLIDILYLLSITLSTLMLLNTSIEGRYPSKWIRNWLADIGFKELETHFFDIKFYADEEFTKKSNHTRQIISTSCTPKLRDALLEKLEEIISEYNHRKVAKDDFFLQRHYVIRAKK